MAKKKQIGATPEQTELVSHFLLEHAAHQSILDAFSAISAANKQFLQIMDTNKKLRTLYLKAIGKLPSSEKIKRTNVSESQESSQVLEKKARNHGKKAFIHQCQSRYFGGRAKEVAKEELKNIELNPNAPSIQNSLREKTMNNVNNTDHSKNLANSDHQEPITRPKTDDERVNNPGVHIGFVISEMMEHLIEKGECDPDVIGGPEDFISLEQEAVAIGCLMDRQEGEVRRMTAEMMQNRGTEDSFNPFPKSTLFHSRPGFFCKEKKICHVDRANLDVAGFRQSFEHSRRYGVSFQVTATDVKTEVLYNPETNERIVAEQDLGPKGFQLTWSAVTTVVVMAIEYLMPLNRLGTLLSVPEKSFSRSYLFDILCYAAEACVDPYIAMIEDLAYHGKYFYGDDCATDTKDMRSENSDSPKSEAKEPIPKQRRFDKESLKKIHKILSRKSKNAKGADKNSAFTTVAMGKMYEKDDASWIIFFFTHFGSFGDVMQDLLKIKRDHVIDNGLEDPFEIHITCDASKTNIPKEGFNFNIIMHGCSMHARRKFMDIPEGDRSIHVGAILQCFSFLYAIEQMATSMGRTMARIGRLRYRWAICVWNLIILECEDIVASKDSSSLEIKAANYCLDNADPLQQYTGCFFGLPDNGNSERLLRPIRLDENATHGRKTERGRMVNDVLRSMIATCHAIGISFEDYLPWLLKKYELHRKYDESPSTQKPLQANETLQAEKARRSRGHELTPHAYLKFIKSQSAERSKG